RGRRPQAHRGRDPTRAPRRAAAAQPESPSTRLAAGRPAGRRVLPQTTRTRPAGTFRVRVDRPALRGSSPPPPTGPAPPAPGWIGTGLRLQAAPRAHAARRRSPRPSPPPATPTPRRTPPHVGGLEPLRALDRSAGPAQPSVRLSVAEARQRPK